MISFRFRKQNNMNKTKNEISLKDNFSQNTEVLENVTRHKRLICNQCERPQRVCWCNYLPVPKISLKSHFVIIIQHPSEKKRKIRTALMAVHGLNESNCQIYVRRKVTSTDKLSEILLSSKSYVMYPSKDSKNLSTVSCDKTFTNIVILDGTWDEAKKIYARSPVLQSLPTIHLDINKQSEYVVRTQPSEKCLSTIETIAHSLAILEDDSTISERLLCPLQMLCKFQLSHGAVEHDNKLMKKSKINNESIINNDVVKV